MARFKKGDRANPKGRPKGSLNKGTVEQKEFFREFFMSEEYRKSVKERIKKGKAVPIEALGHQYAFGKPKIVIETTVPKGPPIAALMAALTRDERLALVAMAKKMQAAMSIIEVRALPEGEGEDG